MTLTLKNKSVDNKVLDDPVSIFVTNNDLDMDMDMDIDIKTDQTLNEQMNKIFTKYSDIKKKLDKFNCVIKLN